MQTACSHRNVSVSVPNIVSEKCLEILKSPDLCGLVQKAVGIEWAVKCAYPYILLTVVKKLSRWDDNFGPRLYSCHYAFMVSYIDTGKG